MQIGYIGLGKMGKNMVLRLLEKGHEVVVWNRSPEPATEVAQSGAIAANTVEEMVQKLSMPRVIWLMLPAGEVTGGMITTLAGLLSPGDIVIDGANSFFEDSVARAQLLKQKQIAFLDAGISGGPSGARNGACVMVGGEEAIFRKYQQLFLDVAAQNACEFFAGNGAGHFIKMVHNGIEYGMMQAIGEGFGVLHASQFHVDVARVAKIYNQRSVIESRLVGWLESGYQKHGADLADVFGEVARSGEGQWTVETAKKMNMTLPVISAALQFRIDSEKNPSYVGQVVSVLRNEFGGHEVKKK